MPAPHHRIIVLNAGKAAALLHMSTPHHCLACGAGATHHALLCKDHCARGSLSSSHLSTRNLHHCNQMPALMPAQMSAASPSMQMDTEHPLRSLLFQPACSGVTVWERSQHALASLCSHGRIHPPDEELLEAAGGSGRADGPCARCHAGGPRARVRCAPSSNPQTPSLQPGCTLLYNNAWDRAKQCLRHANESYLNQVQGTEIPCRRFDCFAICTNKTQKKEKEKTLSTAQSQMYVHIIQRAAGNA
eukprot:scaffold203533_cov18-Tisochrysis_lutea.AAC.2